jgi:DNA (cytosine-5)-methyltransferase 1
VLVRAAAPAVRDLRGVWRVSLPRLLDLFCGAGGAAAGYQRAGFHVTGVDLQPQPRYAGDVFVQADVFQFLLDYDVVEMFDVIHASPPCQHYSTASGKAKKHHGASFPDLIAETRDYLFDTELPYVIENVVNAPLLDPVRYCGSSFGLDLRRHRLFESNVELMPPACDHGWQTPRFRSLDGRMVKRGQLAAVIGVHGNVNYAGEFELRCRAMGIDWMTNAELVQAIPPAYAEHIGARLLERLAGLERAA